MSAQCRCYETCGGWTCRCPCHEPVDEATILEIARTEAQSALAAELLKVVERASIDVDIQRTSMQTLALVAEMKTAIQSALRTKLAELKVEVPDGENSG